MNTSQESTSPQQKPASNAQLIKRFLPYYRPYRGVLAFDLLCALLTTVCDLVLPLIIRYLTNLGVQGGGALTARIILTVGALYLVLRLIDVAANYYMANTGHVMGARIETDMRRDFFDHLQNLSYSFYSNTKIGQLMARMTSDLFDITEFSHHCPEEYFIAAIKIVVSFCILATFNLWLTLIIFAMIPLMTFCASKFNKGMRRAFKKQRHQLGEINAQVEDTLLGVRVVKSFANEDIEREKFRAGNDGFLRVKQEAYRYMSAFQATTRFFDGLMYITVVVVGSFFMLYGKISAGDLMAFLLYVVMLLQTVRRIVEFTEQFQRGMTGIERFSEVMDIAPGIVDAPDAHTVERVRGDIEFDHVDFSYEPGSRKVLDNLSLSIPAGTNVALVGPSGAGKTTLCNLIPRFYDIQNGAIRIDGHDIRQLKTRSLRSHIGMVQQDVYLFGGTVEDNIAYGKPGASHDDIVAAARLAGAHEFIMQLPDGYATTVGERGVKLSGGQKQRLSIARVFLKNPALLILDEATSALDNESEWVIQESLENLTQGRTTLTIAHRLTTIQNADIILVLTREGIVEKGNHEQLMAEDGLYRHLYQRYQTEGIIPA